MNYTSVQDDPLSGQIMFKEYGGEEVMKQRTETLKQVKEISQKVASLSNDIKMETFQSGEALSAIENKVLTVKDNTAKAQKEAEETEILTRHNKKKLICLALLLVFTAVVLFIVFRNLIK